MPAMPQDLLSIFALRSVCLGTLASNNGDEQDSERGTARRHESGRGGRSNGAARRDEENVGTANPSSGSGTSGSGNTDSRGGRISGGIRIDEAAKSEGAKTSTVTSGASGGEKVVGGDAKVKGTAVRPKRRNNRIVEEVCNAGTNGIRGR